LLLFFAKTTLEGYERTTDGNKLVAGLNGTWQFQIDPESVGEAIGWWRPENTGGNWRPIATSTLSWSSQGLRYYKGLAWYRQSVQIPEAYRGKRVFLWVGGIDELAKVWVNGQVLGISPRGSFTPFEMDATEAIRCGEANTVVVCVSNVTLNELGTGGITAPAMFYAPAAGKDAQLRNAKPSHPVFPEY
jgi:beta-galactosidase/beta-glucuronidase